ncbi:MAG: hypothetical protein FJ098_12000, partial [Deltaproteobacteria bacterium]|nr:hypothetical protein [Deltaproteobacteria bacterium]
HGATILGGVLNGVAQSTTHSLGRVVGATIDNSTILRAEGLSDCDIGSSTLGGTALNGNDFGYLADSRVNDSIIWVRSDDRITGNDLGDSHVRVWGQDSGGNASGLMVISGNNFDNILSGQTEALSVQMSTSSYWSLVVENNTFIVQSSDPQAISVGGTPGGSYQYQSLLISGNTFTKGQRAINYTGSLRTVVDGNVTRSTPLGVSASGNLQTGQNFNF